VYWLLDYVERPKPPASAIGDRCEVDAVGFIFQKSQKRIARQKKVEVVWTGPVASANEGRMDGQLPRTDTSYYNTTKS
jgi:hypothetical protein